MLAASGFSCLVGILEQRFNLAASEQDLTGLPMPLPDKIHVSASVPEWTRREFVSTLSRSAGLIGAAPAVLGAARSKGTGKRKRIALLATEVRKYSHAQHFIDRFLEGYGWKGIHHHSAVELAGLYVDQSPDGDLIRDRAQRHRLKSYPTVEDALTLGRTHLAVE